MLTGKVNFSYFVPFIPEGTTSWFSQQAFVLVAGGMFLAGWTTYACETAMCYVSEFRNPEKDTIRDRPHHYRPYRAPDWLVNIGAPVLALLNAVFILFGANTFAPGALWYGLGALFIVIPIFWYRHHYVDKGVWPAAAQEDLGIQQPLP